MNLSFLRTAGLALSVAILTVGIASAAPYAAGSKMESFTAKTQHEKDFTLKPSETRFLLVSHDMQTGKKANAALAAVGPQNLSSKKVVYLANIHGMPGVGRMFALPKMRKYPHTIILGDDAGLIAKFPEQKDKVTVLKIADGKVSAIQYWSPGAEPLDLFLK